MSVIVQEESITKAAEGSLAFGDSEKIACRPLSPPLFAGSALAWKRHQPFGLTAEKFIAFAKTYLRQDVL